MARYSNANGFSQTLAISASRKLSPRWNLNFSASGQDATIVQFLNEPSAASVLSQLPSNLNDLAAVSGVGNFSTPEAASAILGAPLVQTPLQALLLGGKMLIYSGGAGLTYAYSRHLSFHLSSSASGGQDRSGGQDGIPPTNYAMPLSFSGGGGMNWSYSPSPRTDLGFNVDALRIQSRYQNSNLETTTASLGRKMGMHWFLKAYGGGTLTQMTEENSGPRKTLQAVGGGSIGIKTYSDTVTVSYDRSASNSYGLAGTYTNFSGTWSRTLPGSRFSTFASFGQQQINNTGFESFSGWQASAGFSRSLAPGLGLAANYGFFKSSGDFLGNASRFSAHSVRLSMNWSPQRIRP